MGGVVGIIPARAGFTVSKGTRRECTGDHPRSRGVYQPAEGPQPLARGSSPLARGLRAGAARVDQGQGIIPARAGFTPRGPDESRAPADHPRSRGVYTPLIGRLYEDAGSSPLARGLHDAPAIAPGLCGIIPARAGFTRQRLPGHQGVRDHPRSRGVYHLFRGTRRFRPWIIPARAGFTAGAAGPAWPGPDHPRSRGVYMTGGRWEPGEWGSSPLARGLPLLPFAQPFAGGIIPARAGFTTTRESNSKSSGDHPRSRGVYHSTSRPLMVTTGSSPLARGLRPGSHRCRGERGIIPARAGFTGAPRPFRLP